MKSVLHNNFIERSILGLFFFLKESVFCDEYALKKGLLQAIEARFKVITFGAFVLLAISIKNVWFMLLLYFLCVVLACLSKIGLWFFLKRTLLFLPLFSFFIALPAVFNVFSPGEAVFSFKLFATQFVVTRPGLLSAALFLSRVITCASFVILLSLVTKQSQLLKVLRIFKVPQVFVMSIGMCLRYLYLFIEIVENTYLAIKSRAGASMTLAKGRRIVSWNMGNLWHRSVQLNEQVFSAMLSRGYSGEAYSLEEFRAKGKDWLCLFCAAVIILAILYADNLNC